MKLRNSSYTVALPDALASLIPGYQYQQDTGTLIKQLIHNTDDDDDDENIANNSV